MFFKNVMNISLLSVIVIYFEWKGQYVKNLFCTQKNNGSEHKFYILFLDCKRKYNCKIYCSFCSRHISSKSLLKCRKKTPKPPHPYIQTHILKINDSMNRILEAQSSIFNSKIKFCKSGAWKKENHSLFHTSSGEFSWSGTSLDWQVSV